MKNNDPSPFRKIPIENVPLFKGDVSADSLKGLAPTTFKFGSVTVCHRDKRNQFKTGARHIPTIAWLWQCSKGEKQRNGRPSKCHLSGTICIRSKEEGKPTGIHLHRWLYLIV